MRDIVSKRWSGVAPKPYFCFGDYDDNDDDDDDDDESGHADGVKGKRVLRASRYLQSYPAAAAAAGQRVQ